LHNIAKKQIAGKDASHLYLHLNNLGKNRLQGLVQIIMKAELEGLENPHPMIMTSLDNPAYLTALKLYQKDKGFSSQDAAINGIFRALALHYNLLQEVSESKTRGKIKLSTVKPST
jgi:hypothetical protein